MRWLTSFMHPGAGYNKAQEQLDQYYQQGQGALNPYNQQGQSQYGNLNEYIKSLMNPGALQDEWIKNYSQSEASKNAQGMAKEQGLDAASSMGLMGSNTALDAVQGGATKIGLDDRQNYLNDMMQKYMQGAGLSQGIYGQGANAANSMSNNAMNMGNNSAQLAFNKQNVGGNMLNNWLNTGIGVGASMLTGGMGGMGGMGGGGMPWSTGGR